MRRSGAGEIVDSGIIPVAPDWREEKVDSKALIAEGAIPSATILERIGSKLIFWGGREEKGGKGTE